MATAHVVTDIGYGDAGKGALVDFLAFRHQCRLVVRVHGGAQAGHNVVTPSGQQHTFSQFGAACLQPDVHTLHAGDMVVAPLALASEAAHVLAVGGQDPRDRLHIDRNCRVSTPLHQAANRLREAARGANRHGSCGIGFGETVRDGLLAGDQALVAGDLRNPKVVLDKLTSLRRRLLADVSAELGPIDRSGSDDGWMLAAAPVQSVADMLCAAVAAVALVDTAQVRQLVQHHRDLVIEGAQGVLLDEWAGFHPHTTWSTCTTAGANRFLLQVGWQGQVVRHGVLRCFMVRHGAGPLPGEDPQLGQLLPEGHNTGHPWQGQVRKAPLDAVALRYALDVCGDIDELAVTHLDQAHLMPRAPWTVGWRPAAVVPDWQGQTQGGTITRLALPTPPDLQRQARLTHLARQVTVVAGGPSPPARGNIDNQNEWLLQLGTALGVPVGRCAAGPTRAHWRQLS